MHENLLFIRKTLSLARLWNALKIYLSYGISLLLRRPLVWGLPPVLMLEPTNICNLKCPLCPTGAGTLRRPGGYLPLETYRRLVEELSRKLFMVLLWNQGESFLHRDFLEMIRIADRCGIWTYASTNGHFLDDPAELVRTGLGTLLISVDGASAETYQTYRRSGDFQLVLDNMRRLVTAKRELGSATPVIHLQFIIMKHNEHELGEITRLAREIGVDRLTLKTVQIYSEEDIESWLPRDAARSRYRVMEDDGGRAHFTMKHGYPNRCLSLWNQAVVHAGGELVVCCFDKDSDFPMGDMGRDTFQEVWRSKRYQEFRRQLFRNRGRLPMCRNCGEGVKTIYRQREVDVDLRRE